MICPVGSVELVVQRMCDCSAQAVMFHLGLNLVQPSTHRKDFNYSIFHPMQSKQIYTPLTFLSPISPARISFFDNIIIYILCKQCSQLNLVFKSECKTTTYRKKSAYMWQTFLPNCCYSPNHYMPTPTNNQRISSSNTWK